MVAVSDPGGFREIARTVRIEYPIPYICVALGALALACFALTIVVPPAISWLVAGMGAMALLGAVGLPVYAMVYRPELLRSERHSLMTRAFDVMLDKGATQDARSKAGQIVEGTLLAHANGPRLTHPPTPVRTTSNPEVEDE